MYDINKEENKYFFTMEYVSGENVRIMDFGIARSLETKGITGSRMMIGTPEYMSPEQAVAKNVDKSSDIYSLGVLLYEMVSGKLPFDGETPFKVVLKHREEMPQDPKKIRPQIPRSLSQLILKCLEKEKEKRYGNVDELLTDLEKIDERLPVSVRALPEKKTTTYREITVSFNVRKLLVPALVFMGIVIIGIVTVPLPYFQHISIEFVTRKQVIWILVDLTAE